MKKILKRVIGFVEFAFGWGVLTYALYRLFNGGADWKFFVQLPFALLIYTGMVKYGWRWMFGIIDIEEIELKQDDPYLSIAANQARENMEMFIAYLHNGYYNCFALLAEGKEHIWFKAEYFDNSSIALHHEDDDLCENCIAPVKAVIPVTDILDWYVEKEGLVVGHYSLKAIAEKVSLEGYKLNAKSKRILQKIA